MTRDWISEFIATRGRPPRILHIGNIANNAYQISKFLNNAGAQSDVLCNDYYHCMGCPEWDDADYTGNIDDPFFPRWDKVHLHGFERPRWFAQGPLDICVEYLIAYRSGNTRRANKLWRKLKISQKYQRAAAPVLNNVFTCFRLVRRAFYLMFTDFDLFWIKCKNTFSKWHRAEQLLEWKEKPLEERYPKWAHLFEKLQSDAKRYFPDREMEFGEECPMYFSSLHTFEKLFQNYDIVQGYANTPIWPYLAGFENYIAFEHGTIRYMPYEDSIQGRLLLLSYAHAKAIHVTNIDCYSHAQYLSRHSNTSIVCGLHGINIDRILYTIQEATRAGSRQIPFDVPREKPVFFCPSRHDFSEQYGGFIKGDDKMIHAAGRLANDQVDFHLILVNFGKDTEKIKLLIAQYPLLQSKITWCEPLGKSAIYQMYALADGVLDQFLLPAFGAITVEALCAGGGTLVSQKVPDTQMERFFGEQLPTYICEDVEDIYQSMREIALDPAKARKRAQQGVDWIKKYHSNARIVELQQKAFSNCDFSHIIIPDIE